MTEGRAEMRVEAVLEAWQHDLWTPFEVSSFQPQGLPAAFSLRYGEGGG